MAKNQNKAKQRANKCPSSLKMVLSGSNLWPILIVEVIARRPLSRSQTEALLTFESFEVRRKNLRRGESRQRVVSRFTLFIISIRVRRLVPVPVCRVA